MLEGRYFNQICEASTILDLFALKPTRRESRWFGAVVVFLVLIDSDVYVSSFWLSRKVICALRVG